MLGHLNSIKDMAFSPPVAGVSYLASASQDQNIRIWKVQPLVNLAEESKADEANWDKKYETKTSYVLRLPFEKIYNLTLESVIQHHQDAGSSVKWISTE